MLPMIKLYTNSGFHELFLKSPTHPIVGVIITSVKPSKFATSVIIDWLASKNNIKTYLLFCVFLYFQYEALYEKWSNISFDQTTN